MLDPNQELAEFIQGSFKGEVRLGEQPFASSAVVFLDDERTHFVARDNYFVIVVKLASSPRGYINAISKNIGRFRRLLSTRRVESAMVASAWIDPVDLNWGQLIQAYRSAFVPDYGIAQRASDLSQQFTLDEGTYTDHVTVGHVMTGAMEREQLLREYIAPDDDPSIPDRFLFIDVRYQVLDLQDWRPKMLKDWVDRGITYAKMTTDEVSMKFREDLP